CSLVFQSGEALGAHLEVESQRSLNCDLSKPEMRRRKDLHVLALAEITMKGQNLSGFLWRNIAAFVAKALLPLNPERGGVDELNLAFSCGCLSIRQNPHVRGDASVVEKLFRQRDQRLEKIVFEDVS